MKKVSNKSWAIFMCGICVSSIWITAYKGLSAQNTYANSCYTQDVSKESSEILATDTSVDSIVKLRSSVSSSDIIVNRSKKYMSLSDSEKFELATLVNLESGGESYECQKGVASVILNRMVNDNLSLDNVIYAENQFEPAEYISNSTYTESTLSAVEYVLDNGPTLPRYVTFFRADYYHSWGDLVKYKQIDNTYFSYSQSLFDKINEGDT